MTTSSATWSAPARARCDLTDLDEPTLLAQHDPLMSPLVWDLAHIGQQEELWLLRGGDAARPGMLAPDVDSLYDAFKHARADRPALPLLPPVEARAFNYEVRGRVLDLLERTPERRTCSRRAWSSSTRSSTTRRCSRRCSCGRDRRSCSQRRDAAAGPSPSRTSAVFVAGGPFVLGVDAASEPFSLDNERPAHTVDVGPFWIGRVPVSNRQWRDFIADGGYQRPDLWSDARLGAPGRGRPGAAEVLDGGRAPAAGSGSRRTCRRTSRYSTSATSRPRRSRRGPAPGCRPRSNGRRPAPGIPAAPSPARLAVGISGAQPGAGQPGRRGPAPGSRRRLPGQRVGLRRRADDRRRVGVDVVGLRPVAGLHADDLPRLQRAVLRRATTRCCAAGRGRWRPSAIRPSFRNWDHPIRRQIFTGVRLAWDA